MAAWKAGLAAIAVAGLGACGGGGSDGTTAGANSNAAGAAPVAANMPAEVTAAATTTVASAFYVSPAGSDANNGRSPSKPFKTLEKARDEMEVSSIKTVYLLGGTYYRTSPLALTSRDKDESWLAYPGQNPVLNGESKSAYAIGIRGTSYVTVRYLTISEFVEDGIVAQNASDLLIDSNNIEYIKSTGFSTGAILLMNSITNSTISHNYIYDTQYGGIVAVNVAGNELANVKVEFNKIEKTCTVVHDCGGIYFTNHGHNSSGTKILNNVIGNYGTTTNLSKAIYLDDEMSNATVENNIVYGTGTWAIQIHGGDHNVFKNNIFDITNAAAFGIYQWDGSTYANYGMADNEVVCNIVYSSAKAPYQLWKYDLASSTGRPKVSQNIYWGTQLSDGNFGSIYDTAPIWKNPEFANPGAADFAFTKGVPSGCSFTAISASGTGPLAH